MAYSCEKPEIALVFEKYGELSKSLHESYAILVNFIYYLCETQFQK
jgi:hypothetical protein